MKNIAYWQPFPYTRQTQSREPPGGCPASFYRCTHCLKAANGHRTPFCPWCGYEMHEMYEKEEKRETKT